MRRQLGGSISEKLKSRQAEEAAAKLERRWVISGKKFLCNILMVHSVQTTEIGEQDLVFISESC